MNKKIFHNTHINIYIHISKTQLPAYCQQLHFLSAHKQIEQLCRIFSLLKTFVKCCRRANGSPGARVQYEPQYPSTVAGIYVYK